MAEHILIIRLSAIGDIVMSSCLAQGVKQQYPNARVSWIVQSGMESLLDENPYVDEVIIWPRKQWQSLWQNRKFITLFREVRAFFTDLRQRGFSIAIDAQGLLKSGLFSYFSGAKTRIGLDSREGSAKLMTQVHKSPHSKQIGAEYHFLLEKIGTATVGAQMNIFVTKADTISITELLKQQGVNRRFVVFCPFSTREQKNWTLRHWQQLAKLVNQQRDYDCVILGAPADTEFAQTMLGEHHNLFDLTGKTSLRQAAALIKQATALVGVDTGLTHIGVVSNIPTIALFGSTCPYLHTGSKVAKVIYHDLSCAPCKRSPTCDGLYACMWDISADEVMTELKQVLV